MGLEMRSKNWYCQKICHIFTIESSKGMTRVLPPHYISHECDKKETFLDTTGYQHIEFLLFIQ